MLDELVEPAVRPEPAVGVGHVFRIDRLLVRRDDYEVANAAFRSHAWRPPARAPSHELGRLNGLTPRKYSTDRSAA